MSWEVVVGNGSGRLRARCSCRGGRSRSGRQAGDTGSGGLARNGTDGGSSGRRGASPSPVDGSDMGRRRSDRRRPDHAGAARGMSRFPLRVDLRQGDVHARSHRRGRVDWRGGHAGDDLVRCTGEQCRILPAARRRASQYSTVSTSSSKTSPFRRTSRGFHSGHAQAGDGVRQECAYRGHELPRISHRLP